MNNEKIAQLHAFLNTLIPGTELGTDEYGNLIDVSRDPYLSRIIDGGELFNLRIPGAVEKAFLCEKAAGRCHENVANIILSNENPLDRLFTGFALSDSDEWFTHSFIVNDGGIVESGEGLFQAYVGIELKDGDRELFLTEWAS